MWGLRRGLATAAVGGLRSVVHTPIPLLDWPPLVSCCEKNFASDNLRPTYWKLIEDPELSELIKIYNSRCRCWKNRKTSIRESQKVFKKSELYKLNNFNKFELHVIEEKRMPGSKKSSSPDQNNSYNSKLDTIDVKSSPRGSSLPDQNNSNKPKIDPIEEIISPGFKNSSSPDQNNSNISKLDTIDVQSSPRQSSFLDQNNSNKSELDINEEIRYPGPRKSSSPDRKKSNNSMPDINKEIDFPQSIPPSDSPVIPHKKVNFSSKKVFRIPFRNTRMKSFQRPHIHKSRRNKDIFGHFLRNFATSKPSLDKKSLKDHKASKSASKTSRLSRKQISQRNSRDQRVKSSKQSGSQEHSTDQRVKSPIESHIIPENSTEQRVQSSRQKRKHTSQENSTKQRVKSLTQSRKHISRRNFRYQQVSFEESLSYMSENSINQRSRLDSEETLGSPVEAMISKIDSRVVPANNRPSLSFPSLDNYLTQHPSAGNFYSYNFEPLDLVKYKKDFLAAHSQNPIVTKGSWPKIWPKPLKHRLRKVKSEDPSPSLIKKRCKRRLKKSSPSRTEFFPIRCKYHSFNVKNFKICENVSVKERAVACQTEDLPEGSDLCNLCGPPSQPDKPLPVKAKQCQDREALRRYCLRMCQRESISVSVSDSESSENPLRTKKGVCWAEMRRQLEQCQEALELCDQLVEAQLRLRRIREHNAGCRCVPSLETVPSFLRASSTRCLNT